jgi:hypothetical protein
MNTSTGPQAIGNQSHTVSFLREVLSRLAAFKLPPTPENFAWVYRQLQREQNLPVSAEYVNELAILEHALGAFDQLFVADAWLNGKLAELRELLSAPALVEDKKRKQVKLLLEEITGRKEELLYHLAESSIGLKTSVTEVVKEIGRLSASVGGFSTNLTKYQELVENCHDIADARKVIALIADDTRKLNVALIQHETHVQKTYDQIQESGSMVLANLDVNKRSKNGKMPLSGVSHPVAGSILDAEGLVARIKQPGFSNACLMLIELAEYNASEGRVKAFSELLAAKAERSAALGYWGGSQFVFVMPNFSAARAAAIAGEIAGEAARAPAGKEAQPLAFHFGIAQYTDGDATAEAFYKAFELAFANLRPMEDAIAG